MFTCASSLEAQRMERTRIRIVRTPAGEAPLWVREAWVGIEIPLARIEAQGPQFGVCGGDASPENLRGYEVHGAEAMAALRRAGKKDAADWWQEHSELGPHHLVFGRQFCEAI